MTDIKPLSERIEIISRNKIEDIRGWFLKVVDRNEVNNPFPCEVYITSAKPGETKGGHYHKKAKEWFTMIKGEGLLTVINIETNEKSVIKLSDKTAETIYVPSSFAHKFQNIGNEEFILLTFTDLRYQSNDTIGYNF